MGWEDCIDVDEEVCARSPGWYKATCSLCDICTTGSESVVEDWAHEHYNENHTATAQQGMADRLVIKVRSDLKMSRGKYAAQAVHAALESLGVHPGCAVIVLGGKKTEIESMRTTVEDSGLTEVKPGTLTAGTNGLEGGE